MSGIGQDGSSRAKRGRPKNNPDYDQEEVTKNLIWKAAEIFEIPYDDREERLEGYPSVNYVAEKMNTSWVRVRKMLITTEFYSTEASRQARTLYDEGKSIDQISKIMGLGRAAVNCLLPYRKSVYKLDDMPLNAKLCYFFRRRKGAVTLLIEHADKDDWCEYLWRAFHDFEHYPFITQDGTRRLKYTLCDDGINLGGKIYTKAEIEDAFHKIRDVQHELGCVELETCPCCEELYTIFLRIGACSC